jgi:hypothetical protein
MPVHKKLDLKAIEANIEARRAAKETLKAKAKKPKTTAEAYEAIELVRAVTGV